MSKGKGKIFSIQAILAVLCCLLFVSLADGAQRYYVTPNGTGNGSSWANALGESGFRNELVAAGDGDEFWVAKGKYRPSDTDRIVSFSLKSGVSLYGGFSGNETELSQRDWSANITVLTGDLDFNDTTDVHGVTLTADDIKSDGKGNSYSVLLAENVSNTAVLDGFVVSGGNAVNSEQRGQVGGRTCGGGMYANNSNAVIRNSSFIGNFASSNGGGVFASLCGSRVTNCYFSGNTSGQGGGMYIQNSDGTILEDCTFSGNLGLYRAGGLYLMYSDLRVSSSTFSGNRAFDGTSWGDGGALYTEFCFLEVMNCTFSGNRAYYGGGMYGKVVYREVFFTGQTTEVINCTFFGNEGDSGSGLYHVNGIPEVKNCIFWNDGGGNEIVEDGSVAVVTRSVVRDGFPTGSSVITDDPKLRPLADNGGLTQTHALLSGSSAIDKGTSAGAPSTDQRGISRPQGSEYDIGAYEYVPPSSGGGGGCDIRGAPFPGILLLILPMLFLIRK